MMNQRGYGQMYGKGCGCREGTFRGIPGQGMTTSGLWGRSCPMPGSAGRGRENIRKNAVQEGVGVGHSCHRCEEQGEGKESCLMKKIQAVDFALYETVLYLDVYPHSCEALEMYHDLKAQSEALHKEYELSHGPLTAFGNQSKTSWDWMSKPYPWEYGAE